MSIDSVEYERARQGLVEQAQALMDSILAKIAGPFVERQIRTAAQSLKQGYALEQFQSLTEGKREQMLQEVASLRNDALEVARRELGSLFIHALPPKQLRSITIDPDLGYGSQLSTGIAHNFGPLHIVFRRYIKDYQAVSYGHSLGRDVVPEKLIQALPDPVDASLSKDIDSYGKLVAKIKRLDNDAALRETAERNAKDRRKIDEILGT